MGWGIDNYELVRIKVRKACEGYYVRWYYNGWHYWFFLPGTHSILTQGEKYRTYGTRYLSMCSGQITRDQADAIRTIMNTREISLYTSSGWAHMRVEPGSINVYYNQIAGAEIEFVAVIGSTEISLGTGYSPISNIPVVEPSINYCEVTIGTQTWMCLNFASRYPGSKVYDDDEDNRVTFGGLYTFNQINSPGFCPNGWHIPSLAEWQVLIDYVGGNAVAGTQLKTAGFTYWNSPNDGENNYGFQMRSTGFYRPTINFQNIFEQALVWASDGSVRFDYDAAAVVTSLLTPVNIFYAVRLIKDVYSIPELRDYDGNPYTSIIINNQEWIVENLKVTHYSDGTTIPNITDVAAWAADVTGAYCYHDNDAIYKYPYGALYNWWALNNVHGLAYLERHGVPEAGWRVPTETDWDALMTYIGGLVFGSILKEAGLAHWLTPNFNGTNAYGFTALPGGERQAGAGFNFFGTHGFFVAANDIGANIALTYELWYNIINCIKNTLGFAKNDGLSVRLVRYVARIIQDYDGNNYNTVIINGQEWILENLRNTTYADGTPIPGALNDAAWAADVDGSYCAYDQDEGNTPSYGYLYSWFAIANAHGFVYFESAGVPDVGWRVPTKADFDNLLSFFPSALEANANLKETGITHWNNNLGLDTVGFTALGAGERDAVGGFNNLKDYGNFWTDEEYALDPAAAWQLILNSANIAATTDYIQKQMGFSIRCVRDV